VGSAWWTSIVRHLESDPGHQGNLEASVRSRDERHRTTGIGRDLIEAGLN
jgi:hypothetical protein